MSNEAPTIVTDDVKADPKKIEAGKKLEASNSVEIKEKPVKAASKTTEHVLLAITTTVAVAAIAYALYATKKEDKKELSPSPPKKEKFKRVFNY